MCGFFFLGGRGVASAIKHSEILCIIRLDRFLKDFFVKYVPYKERHKFCKLKLKSGVLDLCPDF